MGNKRKYLIFTVFTLSVIYGAWFHFIRGENKAESDSPGTIPVATQNVDEDYNNSDILNDPSSSLTAIELPVPSDKWGKDPFLVHKAGEIIKNNYTELNTGEPKLTGISYHRDSPSFAIINNKVLQTGDKIDGWQLVSIYNNYVIMTKSGITKKLIMGETL